MKTTLIALSLLTTLNCFAESNWNGQYYASHSEMQFMMAAEALKQIDFPAEAKVLDIGSGNGRVTKYLADMMPDGHVIGLDRSPSMVATAQAYASDKISFIHGDAIAIPFKEQFDRVVSFNCLHWVTEIQTALQGIKDALVPGGQACLLIAPIQARYPLHHIIDSVAKYDRWSPYFGGARSVFTLFTFAEWAKLIEDAGMIPERLQLIDGSLDYANEKVFGDWLAGWVPFGTIPEDLRNDYIQDVVKAYTAAIPCEADGTVHFYLDELIIVASKKNTSKTV